jgi:hypothetical protein
MSIFELYASSLETADVVDVDQCNDDSTTMSDIEEIGS